MKNYSKYLNLFLLITTQLSITSCYTYSRYRNYDARLLDGHSAVATGHSIPINYESIHEDISEEFDGFLTIWSYAISSTVYKYRPKLRNPFQITVGVGHFSYKYQFISINRFFLSSEILVGGYFFPGSPRGYYIEPNVITTYQFPETGRDISFSVSTGLVANRTSQRNPYRDGFYSEDMGDYDTRSHEVLIPLSFSMSIRKVNIEVGCQYSPYKWNFTHSNYNQYAFFDSKDHDTQNSYTTQNELTLYSSLSFDLRWF